MARYRGRGVISPDEFDRQLQQQQTGVDPLGEARTPAPGPTRTTSHPYTETNQRKPYLPVEDTSTPPLDEGVSYRQKID